MDCGSVCPICFTEYTSDGSHRIVSLKCGHLFGSECIEKWICSYKRNYCPLCSIPCRKNHIRLIYGSKIESTNIKKEQEMIEKYIKEKEMRKKLEEEMHKLKLKKEMSKAEKATNITNNINHSIKIKFKKYNKIHFFPNNSLIVFDSINQSVVISCYKNENYGLFKYSVSNFENNSFIKLNDEGVFNGNFNYIKDLKMSPFNDSLCILSNKNQILILNIHKEEIIKIINIPNIVTSVSFSNKREIIYAGDIKGYFYECRIDHNHYYDYNGDNTNDNGDNINNDHNRDNTNIIAYKLCNENIHSIAVTDNLICIASVFNFYIHHFNNNQLSFIKQDFDKHDLENDSLICTSVFSNGKNVLSIFRKSDYSIKCEILNHRNSHLSNVKQFFKHKDFILNGYVLITDDSENSINVLDFNTLKNVFTYKFNESVIGFTGDENLFIVLTMKGVYIYE